MTVEKALQELNENGFQIEQFEADKFMCYDTGKFGFCSDEVAVEAPVIAQFHEVGLFEDSSVKLIQSPTQIVSLVKVKSAVGVNKGKEQQTPDNPETVYVVALTQQLYCTLNAYKVPPRLTLK